MHRTIKKYNMKKILYLLFIIPAFLFSCDKIDEANTIEIDTTMSMNIPVVVADPAAILEKSTPDDFPFSASKTYYLSENEDISDYLNKIEKISLTKVAYLFSELGETEVINTLDISVPDVGILATFENISSTNPSATPTAIFYPIIEQAGNKLNASKQLTITVSGTTNTAPMNFTVGLDFDVHVEAEVI